MYCWHKTEIIHYKDGRIFTRKELPHEEMLNASEQQIMQDTLREHRIIFYVKYKSRKIGATRNARTRRTPHSLKPPSECGQVEGILKEGLPNPLEANGPRPKGMKNMYYVHLMMNSITFLKIFI